MKRFKRVCLFVALTMIFAVVGVLFAGCKRYDENLIAYNWEDYIYSKQDLQDDFNEYYYAKTGKTVKVTYTTFDTNETMLSKLINSNTVVDVVCPSEYAIQKLLVNNKLQKINLPDEEPISTLNNVNSEIYSKVGDVFSNETGEVANINDYYVPYMMGTLGILYNADKVLAEDLALGWGLLWNENNNPALDGKIYMKDSIRDSYAAAVLYLKEKGNLPSGYETYSVQELINDTSAALLSAVDTVLRDQKSKLKGYEVDFGKQEMIAEKVLVDLAWSGDAMYAMEEATALGKNLDYFVPEIGGNIWFDGWVIPTVAQNRTAARSFIEFLNQPEVATKNMIEIGYTSAVDKIVLKNNQDVIALLEEAKYDAQKFFADEIRYPNYADSSLGVMKDFGESNSQVVSMWEGIKGSDTNLQTLWIILIVLGVVVIGFAIIYTIRNSKRKVVTKK